MACRYEKEGLNLKKDPENIKNINKEDLWHQALVHSNNYKKRSQAQVLSNSYKKRVKPKRKDTPSRRAL